MKLCLSLKSSFALNDSQMIISFGPCRCFTQAWVSPVWALIGEHVCDTCSQIQSIDQISEMRLDVMDTNRQKACKLQWFVRACIDFSSVDLDSSMHACDSPGVSGVITEECQWICFSRVTAAHRSSTVEQLDVFYRLLCDSIWLQICLTSETRKRLHWAVLDRR